MNDCYQSQLGVKVWPVTTWLTHREPMHYIVNGYHVNGRNCAQEGKSNIGYDRNEAAIAANIVNHLIRQRSWGIRLSNPTHSAKALNGIPFALLCATAATVASMHVRKIHQTNSIVHRLVKSMGQETCVKLEVIRASDEFETVLLRWNHI